MRELGDGGRRGTKRWDGAGGRVGSSGNGVVAAETPETPAVRNERNGREYEGCKKKREKEMGKGQERDGVRAVPLKSWRRPDLGGPPARLG